MKSLSLYLVGLLVLAFSVTTEARENHKLPKPGKTQKALKAAAELCAPATAQSDLNINNVRATILGGGDMWWDLNQARYEVPKGENKHAMFAGALWLGGVDEGNQLKLAAMTYRQRGNDYWTGPLTTDGTASTDKSVCDKYDRHWQIRRDEVENHRAWINCKNDPDCDEATVFPGYTIPTSILEWPGNGVEGELPYMLAPFFDRNGDLLYDPNEDYPAYDLDKAFDCRLKEVDLVYGDQTIWWVYNDRGNVHTETGAGALGFEIRAQAFAFSTNDEVNNMTFNNYRIINRSTFRLTDTYFSTWFDPDLGNAIDDIIGSDIPRGLGYCYNGDLDDEGPLGYGANPPAVGFDFFQGPFADYFDGRDNDRDGCIDAVRDPITRQCVPEDPVLGINERIIMSGFMYFNNQGIEQTTDPDNAAQFYNYMRSLWKNGNPLVVETPSGIANSGNGDGFTSDGSGLRTLYAYPGNTFDTTGVTAPTASVNWYESPANLADKRGLHCAGPFSLAPGALNFITTGVVWARDFNNADLFASVERVIIADDKAQNLFDNCFQVLDGPTAPNLEIVELDRELIINLVNPSSSNNANQDYREFDPSIPRHVDSIGFANTADSLRYYNFTFEGYQIFQLAGPQVSVSDIYDPQQARLVAQCDVKNGITKIVNYFPDEEIEDDVPQLMTLEYNNQGVFNSFRILEDAFATGNRRLVNHREYYYTVVAYAHNDYSAFPAAPGGTEQKVPYLAGRLNNKVTLAIPHLVEPEQGGLVLGSQYGDGVPIVRIEGTGNSGRFTDFDAVSLDEIARNFKMDNPTYLPGFGPFDLKVVDPKKVPAGDYRIDFTGTSNASGWVIYDENTLDTVATNFSPIGTIAEQIIPELGMSMTVENVLAPGNDTVGARDNGVIGAEVIYSDPTKPWMFFLPDASSFDAFNFILAGPNRNALAGSAAETYEDFAGDLLNFYGNVDQSGWGPYAYASYLTLNLTPFTLGMGPGAPSPVGNSSRPLVSAIHGVNIYMTNDRSLWTRVPVMELCEDNGLSEGFTSKWVLRSGASWDLVNGNLVRSTTETGWSYFPGYAIDVETGKRLNMMFGENSWLVGQNGRDMLWNPTSAITVVPGNNINNGFVFGGQHYLYVFADETRVSGQPVDMTYRGDNPQDFPLYSAITNLNNNIQNRRTINTSLMWVSVPIGVLQIPANPYEFMPSEITVKLRMDRPFETYTIDGSNNGNPSYRFSTRNIATSKNDLPTAKTAMDLIRAVPNPYFGSSLYEDSQLDNIVKITNLPESCTVTIYTSNGTRVRQFRKDTKLTFLEWDLRNDYNVPIASGVYLIHIDAGQAGEKVIKWFGTLRPVDLNAF
ncbi:hypothetical protein GC167_02515 [bacterium]|nr:hypothetical protein [bacterium]